MYRNYFSSGTLAQVATVLAKEYGVRVQIGGNKAYTSRDDKGKWFINIPALATNDEYYVDVMRCYLDHEAGHVRFSDMNLLDRNRANMTYILKSVWNIFEDVYIERKMSRSFPGCARNLRVGAERIFNSETQAPDDATCAVLNYILLTSRYNVAKNKVFEDGIAVVSSALPDELKDIIDAHVKELPKCNSTRDTMDLAKRLCSLIDQYIQDQTSGDSNDKQEGDGQGSSGLDSGDCDEDAELGDIPSGSNGTDKKDGGGAASKKSVGDVDAKEALLEALKAFGIDSSVAGESYELSDRVNKILSDARVDEAGSVPCSNNFEWDVYKSLTELDTRRKGNYVGWLSDRDINDALKESSKLSSQLAGLLQTIVMNRGGFSTRGKIDSKRLARVAVGRPDIFSSRVDKKGLDTEVVIAVDVSGSMSGYNFVDGLGERRTKMRVANQSLLSILLALKGIQGVRSMAYVYSEFIAHVCGFSDSFTRRSKLVTQPSGGTPTGDAIQHAMTLFTANARRKIFILLTDGEPDDRSYFRASLKQLKRQGVEVVGVGIMEDSLSDDMEKNEHILVYNLDELTPKLFKVLHDKLVRNA